MKSEYITKMFMNRNSFHVDSALTNVDIYSQFTRGERINQHKSSESDEPRDNLLDSSITSSTFPSSVVSGWIISVVGNREFKTTSSTSLSSSSTCWFLLAAMFCWRFLM